MQASKPTNTILHQILNNNRVEQAQEGLDSIEDRIYMFNCIRMVEIVVMVVVVVVVVVVEVVVIIISRSGSTRSNSSGMSLHK